LSFNRKYIAISSSLKKTLMQSLAWMRHRCNLFNLKGTLQIK
jgi:hypothetical protein